jgi:uncharacterized membrane protein YsdA (DUF1294 family)
MGRQGRRVSPYALYAVMFLLLFAGTTAALLRYSALPQLWACLVGVNAATLVLYAWDKFAAVRSFLRVPEAILHLSALGGGSPAALLARIVFRHKTRKRKFRVIFWAIVLIQVAAGAAWWWSQR